MTLSSFLRPMAWLGLVLLCASAAVAQGPTPPVPVPPAASAFVGDPRIKAALETLKYKFTVNKSRVYELSFVLSDKRSQAVFINSATANFSSLEIRTITSTAYKVKGTLTPEMAQRFLGDNDKRKWGSWRTTIVEGSTYLIYAVQIPADASAATLDLAMTAVMSTADDVEKELSTEDVF